MYSTYTSVILLCMVVTGAGRSVGVKLFYQIGYDNPLFVALLYLLGQSLSLVVYWWLQKGSQQRGTTYEHLELELNETISFQDEEDATALMGLAGPPEKSEQEESSAAIIPAHPRRAGLRRQGSTHGLTDASKEAISWIHQIPWYIKPLIPGFFNICNAALRWASFVFVPASVAEMLIVGTELILSVVTARLVRKRMVSWNRWGGVGIVSAGILLIGVAHNLLLDHDTTRDTSRVSAHTIGNLLIIGQSLMSVSQDITEEIFLQEAEFPAMLLLGLEGMFGLLIAVVTLVVTFPFWHSEGLELFGNLPSSVFSIYFSIGLTLWFTMTGIFNILTTEATSSMTRNVWKNSRTLLVWILGLFLFYRTNNDGLGEGWHTPGSYVILFGYIVMLTGIVQYYR